MAEIRRLEKEDLIQLYKIHTIVYNSRRNFSDEEKDDDPLDHPASWSWGAFEGKKLLAGLVDIEFLMRFDGHDVKMKGIGGVGTLPEARKGGHIRHITEKLLLEAYEKDAVFSTLAPFSHEFYRKFGYEISSTRKNIKIPTEHFTKIKSQGQFIPVQLGDDTSLLEQVHSVYINDINHAVHRNYWADNRGWKRFVNVDPCGSGTFLYLWKDDNGKARSYIKYRDVFEDGDHSMNVWELAFTDMEGLYGALGIVGGLSSQYKYFKWQMPAFLDAFDFTGDAWNIEHEINPREMTRVVNVKKALEKMRRPDYEGQYIIETEDLNISANSGKYLVEFGKEGSKVSLTTKEADIKCDILTLSQLVTGYRTLENAMYSKRHGLEVIGNMKTLKNVFTQRPQHLTEYF